MRKIYLVLFFAMVLLSACKPNSKSPQLGNITNNDKSTGTWSKEYRNKVMQDCINKASEKLTISEAFSYCNCMTKKVEDKYPDENKVELSNEDMENMKPGCLPSDPIKSSQADKSVTTDNSNGWSVSDQRQFIDNCIPTANAALGAGGARDYCNCLLKKLIQKYPDSKDVDKASNTYLSELASECLEK